MNDNGASAKAGADVAMMIMAHERLVVENERLAGANAALKQDRDALVTCVMLLVRSLDRKGPEVKEEIERARRLVGCESMNSEQLSKRS